MKRIVIAIAIVALSIYGTSVKANAQDTGWYAGIHAGLIYSANENTRYGDVAELINGTALVSAGYDFNALWGARVMMGYGSNTSACNYLQYKDMYEDYAIDYYTLKDFSGFIDGTINLSYLINKRTDNALVLKAFAGIGSAFTWAYGDTDYGRYNAILTDKDQFSLGFRVGGNMEYRVSNRLGALVEASVTAFQDNFNGVSADFALDGRATLTFGLVYHF